MAAGERSLAIRLEVLDDTATLTDERIESVMAAVLTWVTTTKSAVLGFAYLFAFSLGMCALLVAVGVSSGTLSRMPRAGIWMVRIKRVFAFVMLGVAEYYLIKMGQLII